MAGRPPLDGARRPRGATTLGSVSRPGQTVVFVHAHPDDEAIFTGGTMRRLSSAGHRVVLVVATGGELGLLPDGVSAWAAGRDVGALAARRNAETDAAAASAGRRPRGLARLPRLGHGG